MTNTLPLTQPWLDNQEARLEMAAMVDAETCKTILAMLRASLQREERLRAALTKTNERMKEEYEKEFQPISMDDDKCDTVGALYRNNQRILSSEAGNS